MELLYLLEKIRNPFFDFLFLTITHIGEETFFLGIAILFFWCVNKREGYFILVTGLVGTAINQGLKLACRINRPWVRDPYFRPVKSAIPEATGYSFPSGHTQNVAGTFGCIGVFSKRKGIKVLLLAIIVLVSFSRMYLGVHTPYDVAASLCIAALLIIILKPAFSSDEALRRYMPVIIGVCALISAALLLFVFNTSTVGVDTDNLLSARKNSSTLFGCMIGLCIVYPIDRYFIDFKTDAKWYSQLIKLSLGLVIVFVLKSYLKSPLDSLFVNEYVSRAVRYLIIVIFAGAVYPLTFDFYSKLRIKALDNLTERLALKVRKN